MDGRDEFCHGLLMWTRHVSSVSKMVGVHATDNCLGGWLMESPDSVMRLILAHWFMCTVTWTAQQFPRCSYGVLLTHWFQIISYQIRLHKGKKENSVLLLV
jgi:hypothetical protein